MRTGDEIQITLIGVGSRSAGGNTEDNVLKIRKLLKLLGRYDKVSIRVIARPAKSNQSNAERADERSFCPGFDPSGVPLG